MNQRAAVFLDRDGVLNRAIVREGRPYPPSTLEELEILPGVVNAIDRFQSAGLLVIVVTNQPDLARGTQNKAFVDSIHGFLQLILPLDAILVCGHDDADDCPCRKPRPGMLLEAARRFHIDLSRSFMVGDRWRDISAGIAAGCRTFLIGDGYGEAFPDPPDAVFPSLSEASDQILKESAAAASSESRIVFDPTQESSCTPSPTSKSRSSPMAQSCR